MNIVIAGGGSVGYITAEYFSREGHNVTVVEERGIVVHSLQNNLDVNVVQGKVTDISALKATKLGDADLFLAMTDDDEANIIACTFAKYSGVPRKIARLNESYHLSSENVVALKDLGVDEIVDAEDGIVQEIIQMMKYPGASDVKTFMDGEMMVAVFSFSRSSHHYGKALKDIPIKAPYVPLGYSKINGFQPFDPKVTVNEFLYLYVACEARNFNKLHTELFPGASKIKSALIFGGGFKSNDTNLRLAKALADINITDVALVLDDAEEAERLSKTTEIPVIFGDPSLPNFDKKQHFAETDAFIAISPEFEKNIFACILAFQKNIPYTISLVRYPDHVNFVSAIPLTSFINPAVVSANNLFRYHNTQSIISRKIINHHYVEVIELIVSPGAPIDGKRFKGLQLSLSHLLAIKRGGVMIAVDANTEIKAGDKVLLFLHYQESDALKQFIIS